MNHYRLLAVDYDGTLARGGLVDEQTVEALRRLKATSVQLVMVTGRRLTSLLATFDHTKLFDAIVVENGAVLYDPSAEREQALTVPPPEAFVDRLRAAGVPVAVGHSLIESVEPHQHAILEAIRDAGLEWHIVFNKGAVMVLPSAVTKATGLARLLQDLRVDPGNVVGIGDAENDHVFLSYCGLSVAVANALPAVKDTVQLVTGADHGQGVIEVVDRWLAGTLEPSKLAGAPVST